jgi:hypothetical protein
LVVKSEAETLRNAPASFEGYFVTPRSNIPLPDNPLFAAMGRMGSGLEEANPPIEVEEKSENDLVVEKKALKTRK